MKTEQLEEVSKLITKNQDIITKIQNTNMYELNMDELITLKQQFTNIVNDMDMSNYKICKYSGENIKINFIDLPPEIIKHIISFWNYTNPLNISGIKSMIDNQKNMINLSLTMKCMREFITKNHDFIVYPKNIKRTCPFKISGICINSSHDIKYIKMAMKNYDTCKLIIYPAGIQASYYTEIIKTRKKYLQNEQDQKYRDTTNYNGKRERKPTSVKIKYYFDDVYMTGKKSDVRGCIKKMMEKADYKHLCKDLYIDGTYQKMKDIWKPFIEKVDRIVHCCGSKSDMYEVYNRNDHNLNIITGSCKYVDINDIDFIKNERVPVNIFGYISISSIMKIKKKNTAIHEVAVKTYENNTDTNEIIEKIRLIYPNIKNMHIITNHTQLEKITDKNRLHDLNIFLHNEKSCTNLISGSIMSDINYKISSAGKNI